MLTSFLNFMPKSEFGVAILALFVFISLKVGGVRMIKTIWVMFLWCLFWIKRVIQIKKRNTSRKKLAKSNSNYIHN